jgi:endonuclease/exonuclease/phosphatase family metal-dependent hydrolase
VAVFAKRFRWRHQVLTLLTLGASSAPSAPQVLTIASWNLEWLVTPATAHASRLACDAGRRAALPCDVARELARDSADFAKLAHYARKLDADVIALQEVENAEAVRRLFRGYDLCVSAGDTVQQTGFAIRRGLAHRCNPPLASLAKGDRQRTGAHLTLQPGTPRQVEFLAVHLKSGCSRDPLDTGMATCSTLATQASALGAWMQQRVSDGSRIVVLGDFNRVGPDPQDLFWRKLQVGVTGKSAFHNASTGIAFSNCYRGQPFTQFIDHIVMSRDLVAGIVRNSFRHHGYRSLDAFRYRLSDHCPISVSLAIGP